MRKIILLSLLCSFFSAGAWSQQSAVQGTITDTVNKKNLYRTSIVILRQSDSTMVGYTRSTQDGSFKYNLQEPGKYIIQIGHPGFADYSDTFSIVSNTPFILGDISLTPRSKLLEEIIVKKTIPAIRFKGDTLVFKADSFAVKAGASVEDMLKIMPGFQVDKNGQITAQGQRVQKVLVDGEEFFSDDPTIATKNLLANMVDDVEVFDKKSDQAVFSGVDDGEKTKTINLKLKEDKKNGYFGKLEGGTDFKNYFNNNAMLNYFKGKKKISGFGIMSNNGKTGLDWQENANYGGNSGNMESGMSDDGGMYFMMNNNDEFGGSNFYGEGIPSSWSAGAHFSNKWDADRQHLNGNYRFNKLNNDATVNTKTQYILPDTLYYQNQLNKTYNSRMRNRLEGIYEVTLDSSSSLKITANGSLGENTNYNQFNTESLNEENQQVNSSERFTTNNGTSQAINSTLLYRKRFKGAGHTMSVTLRQDYNNQPGEGFLKADNRFFDEQGNIVRQDIIDQRKINNNRINNINGRISYTKPISKRSYLEFNYTLANNRRNSDRQTYEKTSPNDPKYDEEVELLTNNLDYNTWSNTGGINYRYAKPKKFNFSIGGSVSQNNLYQKDLKRDTSVKYNFLNFFPQANANFTLKKNKNIGIRYNGSTQQPTIEQLQPIVDNTDPLNVYIGNPDLKLAVNHNLGLNFGGYDFLSESGFYINANVNITQNAFSTRDVVDSLGRRVYQTVNVPLTLNANSFFDYNFKIKKTPWSFSAGYNLGYTKNVNFINGEENTIKSGRAGVNASIRFYKDKKFSASTYSVFTYNFSESSIRTDIKTNYWIQRHDVDMTVFLPWKLELTGELSINLRQKTSVFDNNNNVYLLNAWIDKKLLKNDPLRIRLYAFDILNQNKGFRRNINTNFISERTYNTFQRYLMISVIWNFNKNGKPQSF